MHSIYALLHDRLERFETMDGNHEQSTNARLDQLTDLMSAFIRTMTEKERVNPTPTVEPVPMAIPIPEIRGVRSMFEQFSKRKPKEFHGYTDTALAEHWLMDMERIFRSLPMTDAQKIENASNMLVDGYTRLNEPFVE